MKITHPLVKDLLRHYREISLLTKTKAVLDWDLNVNLPEKAAEGRSHQTAHLAELITNLWLDEDFRKKLDKASLLPSKISKEEQSIIRNLINAGKYYFRVPKELIVEKEKISSQAFMAWKEAKSKNEFSIFLPHLKELIKIDQLVAEHLQYDHNPYDALLDLFEPELTADKAKIAFDAIKPDLIRLVKKIQKSSGYSENTRLFTDTVYPEDEQRHLVSSVMHTMGFDFAAGRVDVSPHPFTTTLDRYDVRITTMYRANDFRTSYTSTMHETGHALYEMGVNPDYSETPLEGGVSFGIHEALSRFWENMVGRNPAFIRYMTPLFQNSYPELLGNITEQDLSQVINFVKPSFVRIDADEVTYSLHIILRFEIENALFNGEIKPEEIPDVWREKSKEYFGIIPDKDSEGALQDVHWAYGAFGYFPAYALGNLYGAQFLHAMKKEIKVDEELAAGNLLPIKGWLDENVHRHGSLYYPAELIKKVSGEKLNPRYFISYLNQKYSKIYTLS